MTLEKDHIRILPDGLRKKKKPPTARIIQHLDDSRKKLWKHPTLRSTIRLEESVRPCGQKPSTGRQTALGMDLKTVGTTHSQMRLGHFESRKLIQNNKGRSHKERQKVPWSSHYWWPECLQHCGGTKGKNSATDRYSSSVANADDIVVTGNITKKLWNN